MLLIEEKRLSLIKSESIKKNNKRKAKYVKIAKPSYKRPDNYRDVCNYVYYIAFSHLQESTKKRLYFRDIPLVLVLETLSHQKNLVEHI